MRRKQLQCVTLAKQGGLTRRRNQILINFLSPMTMIGQSKYWNNYINRFYLVIDHDDEGTVMNK
jgi:hypothetical protein